MNANTISPTYRFVAHDDGFDFYDFPGCRENENIECAPHSDGHRTDDRKVPAKNFEEYGE